MGALIERATLSWPEGPVRAVDWYELPRIAAGTE